MIFFSIWVFFHQHSWITGLQGKGEDISLTPHYHFHSLHRHSTMIRVIILNIYVNHQSYLKQFLNPSWKLFSLMKSLTMYNNQTSIYIYTKIFKKSASHLWKNYFLKVWLEFHETTFIYSIWWLSVSFWKVIVKIP